MQYVQPIKSDTIIANGLHRKHCLFGRTATNARIIKMSPLTATLVSNKCQLSKWCYFTPDIQAQGGGVEDLQGWAFTTLNHTCIATEARSQRGPGRTRSSRLMPENSFGLVMSPTTIIQVSRPSRLRPKQLGWYFTSVTFAYCVDRYIRGKPSDEGCN